MRQPTENVNKIDNFLSSVSVNVMIACSKENRNKESCTNLGLCGEAKFYLYTYYVYTLSIDLQMEYTFYYYSSSWKTIRLLSVDIISKLDLIISQCICYGIPLQILFTKHYANHSSSVYHSPQHITNINATLSTLIYIKCTCGYHCVLTLYTRNHSAENLFIYINLREVRRKIHHFKTKSI